MNPDDPSPSVPHARSAPIEPGRSRDPGPADAVPGKRGKNRGDLAVLLGIGSLLCCPPLGLWAWIIASADLKGVDAGLLSSEGVGSLRAGRVLGILGTGLFVALFLLSALAAYRLPHSLADVKNLLSQRLEGVKKGVEQDLRPRPLSKEHFIYAGLWIGDRGTVIRIKRIGLGDYEYRKDGVSGKLTRGRVHIQDDKLSIGMFGIYSTWKIDRPPSQTNGTWTMVLDGETFTKKSRSRPRHDDRNLEPGQQAYDV